MIKFRCPDCAQKIEVNADAAGVVFACPACAKFIAVPFKTAEEFRDLPVLIESSAPARSRLLLNKVMVALLLQWRHLLDTQETGAAQMTALEERLNLLQRQYGARLAAYQTKVTELEAALDARTRQARQLQHENARLAQHLHAASPAPAASGVDLRDTAALLRA